MAYQIQLRRDTSANWYTTNPILSQGEFGWELDTSRAKLGNAIDPWSTLPYWPSGTGNGNTTIIDSSVYPAPWPEGAVTPILLWDSSDEALFVGATGVGNWVQIGSGAIGVTGANGLQGATGLGATGLQGPIGETGIQGIQGLTGIKGDAGPAGLTGAVGVQGITGANGLTGSEGVQGITGAIGLSLGVTGLQGSTGLKGSDGATGLLGLGNFTQDAFDPPTQLPEIRYSFVDEAVYMGVTGVGGAWIQIGYGGRGLTGAQGLAGAIGSTGLAGAQGETGVKGSTGIGTQGVTGLRGLTGISGSQGLTGIQGSTGLRGSTGLQGLTGVRSYPRTSSTTSAQNITINVSTTDVYEVTALARDCTFATTGSATDNMMILTRVLDTGTAHPLVWNASNFESLTVSRPTSSGAGKEVFVLDLYRSSSGKWGSVYSSGAL